MKNAKLFLFGLALSAATLLSSCNTCPFAGSQHGKVNHAVFVWLKKPGNATDRQKLIDTAKMLKREIPEVEALTVGHDAPEQAPDRGLHLRRRFRHALRQPGRDGPLRAEPHRIRTP